MPAKQLSLFEKIKTLQQNYSKKTILKTSKTNKRTQGDKAESLAYAFLLKQGLTLIKKNYTTKAGEVDLIMRDKKEPETLIFIEVRYRKNADFGGAAASVTSNKQQRIIKAALSYQQRYAPQSSMRFDVVAIEGDNINNGTNNTTGNECKIDWIKSAFDGF